MQLEQHFPLWEQEKRSAWKAHFAACWIAGTVSERVHLCQAHRVLENQEEASAHSCLFAQLELDVQIVVLLASLVDLA